MGGSEGAQRWWYHTLRGAHEAILDTGIGVPRATFRVNNYLAHVHVGFLLRCFIQCLRPFVQ